MGQVRILGDGGTERGGGRVTRRIGRRIATCAAAVAVVVAGSAVASLPGGGAGALSPTALITTIIGDGTNASSGIPGPATAAEIGNSYGVAVDAAGNRLVADSVHGKVLMIAASSCSSGCAYGLSATTAGDVYLIAGGGGTGVGTKPIAATSASLGFPQGLAVAPNGDVAVADGYGSIDLIENSSCSSGCPFALAGETPGDIVLLAGGGALTPTATPVAGSNASLASPQAVAFDAAGDVLDAEYNGYGNNGTGALMFIAAASCSGGCPDGVTSSAGADDIVMVAGGGSNPVSTTPQSLSAIAFDYLNGVTVTPDGDVVVTSSSEAPFGYAILLTNSACSSACPYGAPAHSALQALTIAGADPSVASPLSPIAPFTSGPATQVQFESVDGVSSDVLGNLVITDYQDNVVDEVPANSCSINCPFVPGSMSAGNAYRIAGVGSAPGSGGFSGDNGLPASAQLDGPTAVAFQGSRELIFSDTNNDRVRLITPYPAAAPQGYWLTTGNGAVYAFGAAALHGDATSIALDRPVTSIASLPGGTGYWLAAGDGGVFAFGNAKFYGSLVSRGITPASKVVGIASTYDGQGYWLVTSAGTVYGFGDAVLHGDASGVPLNGPVVGLAGAPGSGGYTLGAADGGVFAYGTASFFGSLVSRGITPPDPVVGIAATPDGKGCWLDTADGSLYAFGDAADHGNATAYRLNGPEVGIAADYTPGGGYWMAATDGGVFAYGAAPFDGSLVSRGITPATPVVGIASLLALA